MRRSPPQRIVRALNLEQMRTLGTRRKRETGWGCWGSIRVGCRCPQRNSWDSAVRSLVVTLLALEAHAYLTSPTPANIALSRESMSARRHSTKCGRVLRSRPAHAGSITCYEFKSCESYLRALSFQTGDTAPGSVATWRPKILPSTLSQHRSGSRARGSSSTLLRELHSTNYTSTTSTLPRGADSGTATVSRVIGQGIRPSNRVAVGHGVRSRSWLATLGEGAGTIGRTGALPALVNKLHRLTLSSIQVYMCPYRCVPNFLLHST